MKKIILIMLLLSSVFSLNALSDAEIKKILIGTSWEGEYGSEVPFTRKLTFSKDGKCSYHAVEMEDIKWEGTYTVANGKINITIGNSGYYSAGNYSVILKKEDNSLKFLYSINSKDFLYNLWSMDYKIPSNTLRKWNNYEILTIPHKSMTVTENLKMRENPDIKSRRVMIFSMHGEDTHVLAKGSEVRVIARSKNKQKVGNWKNYWYLVDINPMIYSWITYYNVSKDSSLYDEARKAYLPGKVWVYGEFLK